MNIKHKNIQISIEKKYYWNKLPWRKIYLRILMLQKQIYQFTKKHKLKSVSNFQLYLLNSNEAKILSIKNTVNKIFDYYIKSQNSKFNTNTVNNLYIIKVLFNDQLLNHKTIKTIIEISKQNLIYLLIAPNQKAKIVQYKCKPLSIISLSKYFLINNWANYFRNTKSSKTIFINIVTTKLQVHQYITKLIANWLNAGYINLKLQLINLEVNNFVNQDNNLDNYKKKLINQTNLVDLISNILCLDSIWFIFTLVIDNNYIGIKTNKFLYYLLNKCYYNIKNNNMRFVNFYKLIKTLSYRIKLNKYPQTNLVKYENKLIYGIREIYDQYYDSYKHFIDSHLIKFYNEYANIFVHNWKRKKSIKNITLRKFKILNYIINFYTYQHNLNNYYTNI